MIWVFFLPYPLNLENERSFSPTLWKSTLAVFGSRHWLRKKPKAEANPKEAEFLACPVTPLLACDPTNTPGMYDLSEKPQLPEGQHHFFYFFRISFPIPLVPKVDPCHRDTKRGCLLLLTIRVGRKWHQSPCLKNASWIQSERTFIWSSQWLGWGRYPHS